MCLYTFQEQHFMSLSHRWSYDFHVSRFRMEDISSGLLVGKFRIYRISKFPQIARSHRGKVIEMHLSLSRL